MLIGVLLVLLGLQAKILAPESMLARPLTSQNMRVDRSDSLMLDSDLDLVNKFKRYLNE